MSTNNNNTIEESNMTPWSVSGKVDYMKQIEHFGTNAINSELIERWERVTKMKAHPWLERGIVFSHQDIDKILDCVENGTPIYLYTGRGPSSESMHLGHLVPFKFTKYLQDALNCILVIQMSDDEKFLFKEGTKAKDLLKYNELTYKNAKDIIACGFDKNKTFMFSNLEHNKGMLYFNNILIAKATNMNNIKGTYGIGESFDNNIREVLEKSLENELNLEEPNQEKVNSFKKALKSCENKESNSVGQCVWPVFQCGPAFATSFTEMFANSIKDALRNKEPVMPDHVKKNMKKALSELLKVGSTQSIHCLVPMAIDQAPYFRMARDVASRLDHPKPAVIHSEFIPGLKQSHGKMSSSENNENSTLFLDMKLEDIENTIKRHAFSGGKQSLEEHKQYGGDIRIDICYQYLTYFLNDTEKLKEIGEKYSNGELTSGEIKEITSKIVRNVIEEHQMNKNKITDQDVKDFFDPSRVLDIGGCYDRPDTNEKYDHSYGCGVDFDRTFGFVPKGERN